MTKAKVWAVQYTAGFQIRYTVFLRKLRNEYLVYFGDTVTQSIKLKILNPFHQYSNMFSSVCGGGLILDIFM